jgi:limonene-1,2-epoxide hydrolase
LRLPPALRLLFVVLLAACGGGPPSPESVVRAWSTSLNSGDNEAAAGLFAPGAQVIQAGRTLILDTEADALRFNTSLPCSGRIVALESDGDDVRATFRLGNREQSRCDAPGAEVTAVFRVREGKIVLWHQLPSAPPAPGTEV